MVEEQLENVHLAVSYPDDLLVPLTENNLLKLRAREYHFLALHLLAYLLNVVHLVYHVAVVDVNDLQLSGFSQLNHKLWALEVLNADVLVSDARAEVRFAGCLINLDSKANRGKRLVKLALIDHGVWHLVRVQFGPRRY